MGPGLAPSLQGPNLAQYGLTYFIKIFISQVAVLKQLNRSMFNNDDSENLLNMMVSQKLMHKLVYH